MSSIPGAAVIRGPWNTCDTMPKAARPTRRGLPLEASSVMDDGAVPDDRSGGVSMGAW